LVETFSQSNIKIAGSVTQTANNFGYTDNVVSTTSTGNITVGGSINQSSTSTGGSKDSDNYVYTTTSHGNISVGLSITQTSSSAAFVENDVYDDNAGNLTVGLSITQTNTGSPSQGAENYVYNGGSGSMMVGLAITQNVTTSTGYGDNSNYNEGSGNFTVGPGGITINESNSSATDSTYNYIHTDSTGSLSTTGVITINAADSTGASKHTENEVYTNGSGASTLSALGIVINDSGSEQQDNYIESDGGAFNIGILGITISGSGSGYHDNEIYTDSSSSPMTIAGSVNVTDTGTGHSFFEIEADATNSPLTVAGNITYDNHLNTVGRSHVEIYGSTDDTNSVLTIKGSLFVTLAQTSGTAGDNQSSAFNELDLGEDEGNKGLGYGVVVNGVAGITGSNGQDKIYIKEAQLKIGANINTMSNPSPGATWHDEVEIDGSSFGSTVLVTMAGPNAQIDINNGGGMQPTFFSGVFEAIMTGPNSVIFVANGSGSGFSHVTFNAGAIAIGSPGAGDFFKYHTANVTGPIIPASFSVIAV